jgi:hypothetical protein
LPLAGPETDLSPDFEADLAGILSWDFVLWRDTFRPGRPVAALVFDAFKLAPLPRGPVSPMHPKQAENRPCPC